VNSAVVLDAVTERAGAEARPENRLEAAGTNLKSLNFHTATAAVQPAEVQNRRKPPIARGISGLESSMNQVQVDQKSYQMPPQDGFTVAHFLTVADIERSARFYERVFGGRILSRGDSSGAPGYIQIANTWLIVNVGGGPTPDKPSVTLSVPADPNSFSSFMNIRVADIQACYDLWRSRGAEFITEPKDKYGETRCYIRDPDGYIIEVGQRKPDFTYG
jgi:predicted enzyme related to lactoylglutathione lyase